MTANFGCCEGEALAMASQPSSSLSEERNRLRLLAWEQRTRETSQSPEVCYETFAVFGEPSKLYKEDELSKRIRRMFGHYENVKSPRPFSLEGFSIPAYVTFSPSDQTPPDFDKSAKPPLHSRVLHSSTESHTGPSAVGCSSQSSKMLSASSSPERVGRSSLCSSPPLTHSQSSELGHAAHQLKSEVHSDLTGTSSSSPPPEGDLPPPSHSRDPKTTNTDDTDPSDRQPAQRSTDPPSESVGAVDVSSENMKQSPKDTALSQTSKPGPLPSQTFPPPLSSKQPCSVVTQKPTAYVRPMDGQDLVASESPELKPSPEPYGPVAEFINKSDLDKANAKPRPPETRADDTQCVEDIMREMTHFWPPVLTAPQTPSTREPSRFLFPAKEGEHVSTCPGQKSHDSSSSISSNLKQKPSSNSSEAAHSSGRETGSSSDSDSGSGSELDGERTAEDPLQPADQSQEADVPALGRGDWQLGNWIRSSQLSSGAEGHGGAPVPESPATKQPLHAQSSRHSGVEADVPGGKPETRVPSHQTQPATDLAVPQQRCENPLLHKPLSADVNGRSSSRKRSKATKASCPGRIGKSVVVTTQTKGSGFTDKPKVKTKAGHGKEIRERLSIKINLKKTQNASLSENKAASKSALVPPAQCPSCGVLYPNSCSCPAQSPAPPGPPSLAPPNAGAHSKSRAESICSKRTAVPQKTNRKQLKQPRPSAWDSRDLSRSPFSLLVKVDLSLLSRVPQTPTGSRQATPSSVKTSAAVRERDGGVSAKRTKTSKKHPMPNGAVEDPSVPGKKRKLENSQSSAVCVKPEMTNQPAQLTKRAKETPQQPKTFRDEATDSKLQTSSSGKIPVEETVRNNVSIKEKKKKNSGGKHKGRPHSEKKRRLAAPAPSQPISHALTNRPLLRPEERRYPVKHYIKEAKRLKHKADAELDKLSKAFNYLDAAMFFVESGIAMERDPHISMSSYTMFSETVELLKFVLKLKSPGGSSSSPSEKDFLSLCLKCQALLQMAMFRHKHKTALKYSKTLTDHFNTFAQATHNPPKLADPAAAAATETTVLLPQTIQQVAFNYVSITTLVLSSHDVWEQAEELAQGGSGLLLELDTVLGPLSLSSGMSAMVRYTRQGVHWLRLDSHKG